MKASVNVVAVLFAAALVPAFGQAPPNDEPAGAFALSTGVNPAAPTGSDAAFFSNDGATDTAGLATCLTSDPRRDVFFSYVAPQTGHVVFALCHPAGLAPGTLHTAQIHVYNAAGTILLGCDDGACGPGDGRALGACHFSAVANVTYLVRVGTAVPPVTSAVPPPPTPAPTTGSFRVTVTPVAAAADAPATAAPLPAFDGATAGSTIGSTASFAGPLPTACTNAGTQDVWYSFTPAASGRLIYEVHRPRIGAAVQPGPAAGVVDAAQVYDATGGAGALVDIGCATSEVYSVAGEAALTAGTPYLLRLAKAGGFGGRFLLTTRFLAGATAPANATCATAAPISAGEFVGSLAGAPYAASFPGFPGYPSVWYAFTPTTNGVGRVQAVGASVSVYDGACGLIGQSDGSRHFACVAGVPLRLLVYGPRGRAFRVLLQYDDPPIPNPTSATPTPLADGTNPASPPGGPYAYFSSSLPPTHAFNATTERAWFSYVATGEGACFETCPAPGTPPGTAPGAEIALYDANLAPLTGAVSAYPCDGTRRITTLTTPGETLYVAVRMPVFLQSLRRAGGTFTLRVGRAAAGDVGTPCPNGLAGALSASPPLMGGSARIAVTSLLWGAGAPVVVFAGPPAAPALAVPVAGVGVCGVYVDALSPGFFVLATAVAAVQSGSTGIALFDVPIPVVPALDGAAFALQAAYATTSGPYAGQLWLTNGVEVVFGL